MELKTSTLREQVSQFYAEDATREQAMEETLNKLNQKKAKQRKHPVKSTRYLILNQ